MPAGSKLFVKKHHYETFKPEYYFSRVKLDFSHEKSNKIARGSAKIHLQTFQNFYMNLTFSEC